LHVLVAHLTLVSAGAVAATRKWDAVKVENGAGHIGSAMLSVRRIDPGLPGRRCLYAVGYLWILLACCAFGIAGWGFISRSGIEVSFSI